MNQIANVQHPTEPTADVDLDHTEINPTVAELAQRRAAPVAQLGNLIADTRARIDDLRNQRAAHEAVGAVKIRDAQANYDALESGRQKIIAQLQDQAAQLVEHGKAEREALDRQIAAIRDETHRQTKAINRMLDAQGMLLRTLDEGAAE